MISTPVEGALGNTGREKAVKGTWRWILEALAASLDVWTLFTAAHLGWVGVKGRWGRALCRARAGETGGW